MVEQTVAVERSIWIAAARNGYAGSVENLKALVEGNPLPYQ